MAQWLSTLSVLPEVLRTPNNHMMAQNYLYLHLLPSSGTQVFVQSYTLNKF